MKTLLITIIILLSLSLVNNLQAGEGTGIVRVDIQGNNYYYDNLSDALRDAVDGDSILIYEGVYRGNFVISKSLSLIGVGTPVIDGLENGTVLTVKETSNVYIKGVRIIRSGLSFSTEDSGLKIVNSSNIVVDNVVINDTFYSILIKQSDNTTVINSLISSTERKRGEHMMMMQNGHHPGGGEYGYRAHGIYIWNSDGLYVYNNTFVMVADGVYGDHTTNMIVINNTVTNGRYGVHLMYCDNVYVSGNLLYRLVAGAVPMYSENVTIVNNSIVHNRGRIGIGIFIQESDDVYIKGNLLAGNMVGIYMGRSPYTPGREIIIAGNLIAFNYIALYIDTISIPQIYLNSFIENAEDIRLYGYGDPDAKWYNVVLEAGNYWSNYRYSKPLVISSLLEDLIDQYKAIRILQYSPAFTILEVIKKATPVEARVKAVDPYPLEKPPIDINKFFRIEKGNQVQSLIIPPLTSLPLLLILYSFVRWRPWKS
jgi:nitrous oxidase accessory protein